MAASKRSHHTRWFQLALFRSTSRGYFFPILRTAGGLPFERYRTSGSGKQRALDNISIVS